MRKQPHAHPQIKHDAARLLHEQGYGYVAIARCLCVSHQTIRRWLVPGERERHNAYMHAYQKRVYKPKGPDPSRGRCKEDASSADERIYRQRERLRKEGYVFAE